jgi:hypothetical protein
MKATLRLILATIIAIAITTPGLLAESPAVPPQPGLTLPTDLRLGQAPPDLTIIEAGGHIAGIGDFNGDGAADLLIAYNKFPESSGTPVTAAGIVFGKPGLPSNTVIDLSKRPPDLSVIVSGGVQGRAVQTIGVMGDLNGDGIDDLIVTAGSTDAPVLYTFFGSRSLGPGSLNLSQVPPDVTVLLSNDNTLFAGLTDLNGDGNKDIILQPEYASQVPAVVSVLFGPYPSGRVIDLNTAKPDVTVIDHNILDRLHAISGDVNGDGIDDLVVSIIEWNKGFPFEKLCIVLGSPDVAARSPISPLDAQGDSMFPITGTAAAAADLNGDGIDDIVIANPTCICEAPPSAAGLAGSVSIVFGRASFSPAPDSPNVLINGDSIPPNTPYHPNGVSDLLGWSIAVGDIDGDGIRDLLIGAPAFDLYGADLDAFPGQVYGLLGSKQLQGFSVANREADLTIGREPGMNARVVMAGAGDLNGDGISDIVVEVLPSVDPPSATAYAFFGAPLRPPVITGARLIQTPPQLQVTGSDLTGAALLEVNGALITTKPTFNFVKGRLTFAGAPKDLNLHQGKNEITIIRRGARSNTIKLRL